MGTTIGVIKGDTRSLDHGSRVWGLGFKDFGLGMGFWIRHEG